MRRVATWCVITFAFLACSPSMARAQARAPRFEVSAGALFIGGYSAGSMDANLTTNQSGGSSSTLFSSESKVDAATGIEARFGVHLSRRFMVEGGVFTARPQLTTRVSGDIEGAPDARVSETLSVYVIDGAFVGAFGAPESRVAPFVRIGAGYVRELHEDNMLVETGQMFHAGGGATVWLNQRRTVGARFDARVIVISGGIDLGEGSRTQGAAAGMVVFAF